MAQHLAEFNVQLLETVRRQMGRGQASAADLVLAEVENQSMVERLQTAQQEYIDALTDLRDKSVCPVRRLRGSDRRLKVPEGVSAGDEEELLRMAVESHPEMQRRAGPGGRLARRTGPARADRIVVPSVGPYYEHDEAGITLLRRGH